MRWFAKAVLYATLLAWPGHLLAAGYQSLLLALTGVVLGTRLAQPTDRAVDLSAANVLTIYVALCFASDFAPWARRARAVLWGIPLLVALEVATGVLGLEFARSRQGAAGPTPLWGVAIEQVLELSRWIGVPGIWLLLLGRLALADWLSRPDQARRAGGTK